MAQIEAASREINVPGNLHPGGVETGSNRDVGFTILDAEAELAPHGLDTRVEPAADGDVDAAVLLLGDGVEQQ